MKTNMTGRRPRSEDDGSSSTDVSVRGKPGSLDDRRITNEEWDERVETIETHGLPVRLVLDPLPEDPELYEPNTSEWVEDDHHEDGGYYTDKRVLLNIRLIPLNDLLQGFPRLANRPRRHGEAPYHISLCFTSDLHRFDLYDRNRGVRLGKQVYQSLRARYNGRMAILRGRVRRTVLELNGRTHVHQLTNNNIVRDNEVWALHDCGEYHGRKLHVSL